MPKSSVAIDGPVASGKSTAARAVAQRLAMAYVDTGAMYRAVTLLALREGVDPSDEPALVRLLHAVPVAVQLDADSPLGYRIQSGGNAMGQELFGEDVSRAVSLVSAHPRVRNAMVEQQRALAQRVPVVMAGRDVGTVVLPEAICKVFLTASLDSRVARRGAELSAQGMAFDQAGLRRQIEERDRLDSTRPVGALRPADGAVVIDSSDLTIAQVVDGIVRLVDAAHHERPRDHRAQR